MGPASSGSSLPRAAPSDSDSDVAFASLVDELLTVRASRAALDAAELALVNSARRQGIPWAALAPVLGVATAQGACQRAKRLAERVGDHVDARAPITPQGRSVPRSANGRERATDSRIVWSRTFRESPHPDPPRTR